MIHAAHAPYSVVGMKPFPDKLYVITPINNPERYLSRWRLFRAFFLAQVVFLPGRGRYAETVVLAGGQPMHEELFTSAR